MDEKVIFGIDLGNKQTKLYDGTNTYVMPSSLVPASKIDGGFSIGKSTDRTKFETKIKKGGEWYWGKGILSFGKDKLTDSLMHDTKRYSSRPYQNLCEISLAQLATNYPEAKDGVLTVDYVVAGLPSDDYYADGDVNVETVKKNFIGKHLVIVDGDALTIDVKECLVAPQSQGTIMDIMWDGFNFDNPTENQLSEEQAVLFEPDSKIGVVDIGGGTILLDTLEGRTRASDNHKQYTNGADTLHESIANAVGSKFNFSGDVNRVEKALREGLESGEFVYQRSKLNVYDITDIVVKETNEWTYDIVDKINRTFSNLGDMDLLIVTGGGSNLINKEILEDEFKDSVHVLFADGSEIANVKGFYYTAKLDIMNQEQ